MRRRRRQAREEARGEVTFNFGFFAVILPAVALVAGAGGIGTGLATAPEVVVTVALMVGLFVSMTHNWRIGTLLYRAIVTGTAEVVVRLAPVPLAGNVAAVLGYTVVLWFPIVTLAGVALVV